MLIHAARNCAALFLDVYIREVLRQSYFGGVRVPDDELRAFAQARCGPHQGYVGLYLTTIIDAWAKQLGVTRGCDGRR
jgi:3-methyladenine DNA glycosylase/8-oxoguanine DNA glycosylase